MIPTECAQVGWSARAEIHDFDEAMIAVRSLSQYEPKRPFFTTLRDEEIVLSHRRYGQSVS